MRVVRWLALLAALPLTHCTDCSSGGGDPTPSISFEEAALEVSCTNGFDLEAVDRAPDGSLWGRNHRGLYRSQDEGLTWERFYHDAQFEPFEPDRATRPFPWREAYFIDAQTWFIAQGVEGFGWPPRVLLSEDAGATFHVGRSSVETVTYNGQTGFRWDLEDGRAIFTYLGGYWLTADGGATARPLMPGGVSRGTASAYVFNPYRPDQQPSPSFYAPDLQSYAPICPSGDVMQKMRDACNTADGCNPDFFAQNTNGCVAGQVLAVGDNGAHAVALDRRVVWTDGSTWHFQEMPHFDLGTVTGLWFAGTDLWIDYRYQPDDQTSTAQQLFRIAGAVGGERKLERVQLRAGDGVLGGVVDVETSSQETLVIAATTPSAARAQNLLCRVGDSVEVASWQTGTPATFEPGRLYLHARRGRWSDMFDRLALRSDGAAFIASWRQLHGRVPPGEPLWDLTELFGLEATIAGVSTNAGLQAYVNAYGASTALPDLHILSMDPIFGLPYAQSTFAPIVNDAGSMPMGWIYAVSSIETDTIIGAPTGSWPLRAANWTPSGRRAIPGIATATPAGFALVKPSVGPEQFADEQARVGWRTTIGLVPLLEGEIPEASPCGLEPVEGPNCLIYPGEATAMSMETTGWVYVVDGPRGTVSRKRAGDASWQLVAQGLMHPADLVIRETPSGTRVYVLDGDVWVFEPGEVPAQRRAASASSASYEVAVRDPAELLVDAVLPSFGTGPTPACVAGAPCFSPPEWSTSSAPWKDLDGVAVIVDQDTLCLPGQDYGASGTLYAGLTEIPTTTWSPSNVCFAAAAVPPEPRRGTLWMRREDGTPSHVLPYIIDPQPYRGRYGIDVETPLPPIVTTTRVLAGCKASREQNCPVAIYNAPIPATATIGGLPANILLQDGATIVYEWPAGLAAGKHTLDMLGVQAEVELTEIGPLGVARLHVDQIGAPEHGQAVAEAFGRTLMVLREGGVRSAGGFTVPDAPSIVLRAADGQPVPPLPDDQHALQEDMPRLIADGAGVTVMVRRASYRRDASSNGGFVINEYRLVEPVTAGIFQLRDTGGTLTWQSLPDLPLPGSTTGSLQGLTEVDGRLFAALHDDVANRTHVFGLDDVGAWVEVTTVDGPAPRTVAAAGVLYVVGRDNVTRLVLGAAAGVPTAVSDVFGLPIGTTIAAGAWDDGLALVREEGPTVRLHRLAADAVAFETIGVVPAVPGLNERTTRISDGTEIPGVAAVAGSGSRSWVAVRSREGGQTGLRVAEHDGASWATTEEFAGRGAERLCVGPLLDETAVNKHCISTVSVMADGCTLYACADAIAPVAREATVDRVSLHATSTGVAALFDTVYGQLSITNPGSVRFAAW